MVTRLKTKPQLQTSVTLPDLLVSHLSEALTGQSLMRLLTGWFVVKSSVRLSGWDYVAGLSSVHLTCSSCCQVKLGDICKETEKEPVPSITVMKSPE